MTGPAPDKQKRATVRLLYEQEEMTMAEIARELDVSRQAVRQMLLKMGVKLR